MHMEVKRASAIKSAFHSRPLGRGSWVCVSVPALIADAVVAVSCADCGLICESRK